MTPTLFGRWQSRFFLMAIVGGCVTLIFALALDTVTPFLILGGVFALGLAWDVLYTYLQSLRWDYDWPPTLQLAAGLVEGLAAYGLLYGFNLLTPLPSTPIFWLHYSTVWVGVFLASQSLMRLIFPRWRYQGGQWL